RTCSFFAQGGTRFWTLSMACSPAVMRVRESWHPWSRFVMQQGRYYWNPGFEAAASSVTVLRKTGTEVMFSPLELRECIGRVGIKSGLTLRHCVLLPKNQFLRLDLLDRCI